LAKRFFGTFENFDKALTNDGIEVYVGFCQALMSTAEFRTVD